ARSSTSPSRAGIRLFPVSFASLSCLPILQPTPLPHPPGFPLEQQSQQSQNRFLPQAQPIHRHLTAEATTLP
ncbi:hypothetical protein EDD21DRAFT_403287, partial [Dissophora ornata]